MSDTPSGEPMRPLEEVRAEVLAAMPELPVVEVALADALGFVVGREISAPHDLPPFANSAMDGYAVRGADVTAPGVELKVTGEVAAGSSATVSVAPGEAVKIMTGAPIPAGADTIVKVEDTSASDGSVTINAATPAGTSVRPAGGDIKAGEVVVEAGIRLAPPHLGLLASFGIDRPPVRRRPRVAVISTGDELVAPDTPNLAPGQIRDANRTVLLALLVELGALVIDRGIIRDDGAKLSAALHEAADHADMIITSGGVSMGDYDVVKLVGLDTIEFYHVAMQPGKPFAFGSVRSVPFFGLPGNPVSVLVSFEQFARPALLQMMGSRARFRPQVTGTAGEELATNPEKQVFVRVAVDWTGAGPVARLSGGQSSNQLAALAAADAFAVIPVGVGTVEPGSSVTLEMFKWPEQPRSG